MKDKDYVVVDGKVKIIDELTGRILEGRRYGDGLHQSIEAKENLEVMLENQTLPLLLIRTISNFIKNSPVARELL